MEAQMRFSNDRSIMSLTLTDGVILTADGDDDTNDLTLDRKRFYYLYPVTEITLGVNTSNRKLTNSLTGLAGVTVPAGVGIPGDFDRIVISSGVAIAYITPFKSRTAIPTYPVE